MQLTMYMLETCLSGSWLLCKNGQGAAAPKIWNLRTFSTMFSMHNANALQRACRLISGSLRVHLMAHTVSLLQHKEAQLPGKNAQAHETSKVGSSLSGGHVLRERTLPRFGLLLSTWVLRCCCGPCTSCSKLHQCVWVSSTIVWLCADMRACHQ
jgi:hypothetical protein